MNCSETPEIETADLSQSYAGLNLSQFQTVCLLRINSSTSFFKLFELILGIVTTLTNEKYWCLTVQLNIVLLYTICNFFV